MKEWNQKAHKPNISWKIKKSQYVLKFKVMKFSSNEIGTEHTYNFHYGNGVPAVFTSKSSWKANIAENPIAVMEL